MRVPRRMAIIALAALAVTGLTAGPAGAAPSRPASAPIGVLESIEVTPGGVINVVGWSLNPLTPSPVMINMWLLFPNSGWGYAFGQSWADRYRPDIGAIYPGYGPYHGFFLSNAGDPISLAPSLDPENPGQFIFPGDYDLCAQASTGYANTWLGCRRIHLTQEMLSIYWP